MIGYYTVSRRTAADDDDVCSVVTSGIDFFVVKTFFLFKRFSQNTHLFRPETIYFRTELCPNSISSRSS